MNWAAWIERQGARGDRNTSDPGEGKGEKRKGKKKKKRKETKAIWVGPRYFVGPANCCSPACSPALPSSLSSAIPSPSSSHHIPAVPTYSLSSFYSSPAPPSPSLPPLSPYPWSARSPVLSLVPCRVFPSINQSPILLHRPSTFFPVPFRSLQPSRFSLPFLFTLSLALFSCRPHPSRPTSSSTRRLRPPRLRQASHRRRRFFDSHLLPASRPARYTVEPKSIPTSLLPRTDSTANAGLTDKCQLPHEFVDGNCCNISSRDGPLATSFSHHPTIFRLVAHFHITKPNIDLHTH
ncbi:hypothetical protein CMUS01_08131 [Colletotrichum musicola]|uniref:Uncharacterized protein n=1 Tax=Colletotrichum musicola TaxID=2175873 RepID=A0A8H6KEB5_9PEZI|nr:hypothetical protein CMUS01_08131 [Colletotrichum musicola]